MGGDRKYSMGGGVLVVHLNYHKSKKTCMVQKSSIKKDALLPWSQRRRACGRVRFFMPSHQLPRPLPQLPGGRVKVLRHHSRF